VAVVVAAFNEETTIASRIENLLQQDYPLDRLQVLIGCDGCTDGRSTWPGSAGANVTVHAFAENRGKSSVLNDLVARPAVGRRLHGREHVFGRIPSAAGGRLRQQHGGGVRRADHAARVRRHQSGSPADRRAPAEAG
jgi:hypothetical protein